MIFYHKSLAKERLTCLLVSITLTLTKPWQLHKYFQIPHSFIVISFALRYNIPIHKCLLLSEGKCALRYCRLFSFYPFLCSSICLSHKNQNAPLVHFTKQQALVLYAKTACFSKMKSSPA